jgi:hypothetical protein
MGWGWSGTDTPVDATLHGHINDAPPLISDISIGFGTASTADDARGYSA